jgi:hypothetical protein
MKESCTLTEFGIKPEFPIPPRHPLQGPAGNLIKRFYPYGFAVDVNTNSAAVLEMLDNIWLRFTARFQKPAIECEIIVTASDHTRLPPEPRYHIRLPFLTTICDGDNFSIVDLDRGAVRTQITEAALHHRNFVSYFLLPTAISALCTLYVTPIHGACVSWNGCGILLCGECGVGKSTLAYFCARSGWTYTTDDASFLLDHETGRQVTGNCHQARLRPEASVFFPEIENVKVTAHAKGQPSVEISMGSMNEVSTSPTAEVSYIVFLNRSHAAPAGMRAFSRAKARDLLCSRLYGTPDQLRVKYQAVERLLSVPIYELCYRTLPEAVHFMRALAEEGHDGSRVAATE